MSEQGMTEPAWSRAQRIAFRFLFVYAVFYLEPFPLNNIPWIADHLGWHDRAWQAVATWVGIHVLRLAAVPIQSTGSGDTTLSFVLALVDAVLATAAAIIWSAFDHRKAHPTLLAWLRAAARLWLGTVMIGYGAYKVIQSQFPFPTAGRLLQAYGDSSPMGLLWTFMGLSRSYNVFTGAAEMLGGTLLFFRRTTSLGALVCIGTLSNVVMLNFGYDVPVKLYSVHLLAAAVLLLAPDLRRLTAALVLGRAAAAGDLRPLFGRPRPHRVALGLRGAFLALVLYTSLKASWDQRQEWLARFRAPAGYYAVEEFARNGVSVPPIVGDATRWKRVSFVGPYFNVRYMNDSAQAFTAGRDTLRRQLTLASTVDSSARYVLGYERPDSLQLLITGRFRGDSIRVRLSRVDASRFLLVNRGFHWVQEQPFNH